MCSVRTAVVIFTKVPKAGETKTRLTIDKGGIFTPEEAAAFYTASLLDVIDSCVASGCCDLYICQNESGAQDYLQQLIESTSNPQAIREIFKDHGGTFDQGMQYAFDYILKDREKGRLADSAIIVGGDNPAIQPATLREAVRKLEAMASGEKALACARKYTQTQPETGAAMIESIDQEGGFNLIGYTYSTPFSFDGVFYNQDGITALDMIALKAAERQIPISIVEMITDVDLPTDLASFLPTLNTLELAAQYDETVVVPKRTMKFLKDLGLKTTATAYFYGIIRED
jgi:glycosyltransferase A (GT-A) superfamily protein (DUF2064 family)